VIVKDTAALIMKICVKKLQKYFQGRAHRLKIIRDGGANVMSSHANFHFVMIILLNKVPKTAVDKLIKTRKNVFLVENLTQIEEYYFADRREINNAKACHHRGKFLRLHSAVNKFST
jgi:hypothetical protein